MTLPEPGAPAVDPPPRANGRDHDAPTVADRVDRGGEPYLLSPRGAHLPPLRRFDDDIVAEVQRQVTTTTEPLHAIAAATGVSLTTVSKWRRERGWLRPPGAPPPRVAAGIDFAAEREKLTGRLYRALGRQLGQIERRGREAADGAVTEKDARALALIARTLDTLSALDRDAGAMRHEPELPNRAELEADLARRIAKWAEGGD